MLVLSMLPFVPGCNVSETYTSLKNKYCRGALEKRETTNISVGLCNSDIKRIER